MKYTLTFHKNIEFEIKQAKIWYRKINVNIEKKLVDEIKRTIKLISKNPFLYQIKYKNIRTAYTKIFKFGIHFYIDENTNIITIMAICHTSRNPDLW